MDEDKTLFMRAFLLDKRQGGQVRFLTEQEVSDWTPEDGFLWIHLDLEKKETFEWIYKQSGLDEWEAETFLEKEGSRPRCLVQKNGVFMTLRALDLKAGVMETGEMSFFHAWCEGNRLLTASLQPVFVFQDIEKKLSSKTGPSSIGEFIDEICGDVLDQVVAVVSDLEDDIDGLEENIVDDVNTEYVSGELSEVRRKLAMLRRYLAPQRDVFDILTRQTISWLTPEDHYNLQENAHRMVRVIEDIDNLKERMIINADELASKFREDSQKNMYMLTVVATLFIPLSFVTGLLGINVGGIPFAESEYGFLIICGILFLFCLLMLFIFRRIKWI